HEYSPNTCSACDRARALPRLETLLAGPRQRLDGAVQRLGAALGLAVAKRRGAYERSAGLIRPETLRRLVERRGDALAGRWGQAVQALARRQDRRHA
ncbi:MAG: hypothetical protein V4516_09880, partial [Pseudomonadota bacterium]